MNNLKISTQLAIRIIYLAIILGGIFFVYKFRVEATEKRVDVISIDFKNTNDKVNKNETNIALLQKDVIYIKEKVDDIKISQSETAKDIKKLLSRNDGH